jgi:hypothetical protein
MQVTGVGIIHSPLLQFFLSYQKSSSDFIGIQLLVLGWSVSFLTTRTDCLPVRSGPRVRARTGLELHCDRIIDSSIHLRRFMMPGLPACLAGRWLADRENQQRRWRGMHVAATADRRRTRQCFTGGDGGGGDDDDARFACPLSSFPLTRWFPRVFK